MCVRACLPVSVCVCVGVCAGVNVCACACMRACVCLNSVVGNGCHNARVAAANVADAKYNNAATRTRSFAATKSTLFRQNSPFSRFCGCELCT